MVWNVRITNGTQLYFSKVYFSSKIRSLIPITGKRILNKKSKHMNQYFIKSISLILMYFEEFPGNLPKRILSNQYNYWIRRSIKKQ